MSGESSNPARHRYASLAGLLACIAAIAVITAWFQQESKGDYLRAALMLGGFASASLIVCANSPSLTAASIRMAVGAALMLASVAWAMLAPVSVGWQYRSVIHWVAYWALATVVLPMLVGPALARRRAASGRQQWVDRLRQVPAGFLLFLLTMILHFAIAVLVQTTSAASAGARTDRKGLLADGPAITIGLPVSGADWCPVYLRLKGCWAQIQELGAGLLTPP